VLVRRINYPRIPKLGALIMLIRFALALLRDYRDFDVIHVHIVRNLAPLIGALRPLLRGKLIAKISGATEMSGGLLDPAHRHTIQSRTRNSLLRRFDYIQAISTHTRAALLDAGYDEAKIIGIPNGVNTARFCAAKDEVQPSGKFHAIYAGRLAHVKGVDILLQAWAKVVVLYSAQLTILGEGQEFKSLRKLAAELEITGCVEFVGDCDDIAPFLARADVYVQPSRDEGLPNAVIEAMAVGLPIVASSVGGNKDLVIDGSTGLLVKPESSEELTLAVCSLFSDRVLIRRMGDLACRRAVDQYSIENVVSRLLALYSGRTGAAAAS
jgi:glycosyltransferase involved in cell wall biosynthesis